MQDPLQAAAVKSCYDLLTHDDHRGGLASRDSQQRCAGVRVFGDIVIGKCDAMSGKKLFHVLTRASQR
jgi:hypothetical protein